jgi:NADH dehydrogenase
VALPCFKTSNPYCRRWLTFALVGAGPTGVELAGQIREVATKTLRREYRHIQPGQARVLLFEGHSAPLATFGPSLSARAAKDLRKLGVELHMGSTVAGVDAGGLEVRDRDGTVTRHDAGTVLWTAGVEAPPLADAVARATGADRDRAGRIKVGDDLTIPGHPEIFVLGDLMSRRGLPGVAEVAMQSGLYAAHRIRRQAEGREHPAGAPEASGSGDAVRPFRYRDLGSAAYISRGRAVISVGRLHAGGFWAGWRGCSSTSRSSPATATGSARY